MKVEHPLGFSLIIPDDWEVQQNPAPDMALALLAPDDGSGFRTNITVTVGEAGKYAEDIASWHVETYGMIVKNLKQAQLIDAALEGTSFRRLISYVHEEHALSLEQWMLLWRLNGENYGITISATNPTLQYATEAPYLQEIAWSLNVVEGDIS